MQKKPIIYLRLLTYDNALKVQNFILKNFPNDNTWLTEGALAMHLSEENIQKTIDFIKSLEVIYEITDQSPDKLHQMLLEIYKIIPRK